MREQDPEPRLDATPPDRAVSAGPRWRALAIVLGVVGLLVGGAAFATLALFGQTTVVVTNVGDRPVEGLVLLAVDESMDFVQFEWPIGTLLPGETRELGGIGSPDANLAVRVRAADGSFLDDRIRIYLGSSFTQHVSVDVTASGVRSARYRRQGGEESVYEPTRFYAKPHPGR